MGREDGLEVGKGGLEQNDSCEVRWTGAEVFCKRDVVDVCGP
jgi:hypothetical protein